MSQLLETPLIFISLFIALIDACARKQLKFFNLAVKIDLVEEVCYLNQVCHLLCDLSVTPVEASLTFFNIIDSCIIR